MPDKRPKNTAQIKASRLVFQSADTDLPGRSTNGLQAGDGASSVDVARRRAAARTLIRSSFMRRRTILTGCVNLVSTTAFFVGEGNISAIWKPGPT